MPKNITGRALAILVCIAIGYWLLSAVLEVFERPAREYRAKSRRTSELLHALKRDAHRGISAGKIDRRADLGYYFALAKRPGDHLVLSGEWGERFRATGQDLWGRAVFVVLEPDGAIKFRSRGANGVDDHGGRDDVTITFIDTDHAAYYIQ